MPDQKTSTRRVQRRRDKLRAAGLRPVQIWVPDIRAPGFAEECTRQCRLVAAMETAVESDNAAAWFEVSDRTGWTA